METHVKVMGTHVKLMETHVKIAGILQIVYSALGLISGIVLFFLFGVIGFAIPAASENPDAVYFTPFFLILATFVAGFLVVISLPGILGGYGMMKYANWGRILSIIVSIFYLTHIPLGTILGIYNLWVLFSHETIQLFEQSSKSSPPVSPNQG